MRAIRVRIKQRHSLTAAERREKAAKRAAIRKMNMTSMDLEKYLEEHELDPSKDWRNDPDHGPTIRKFLIEMQKNKAKVDPPLQDKPKKKELKKKEQGGKKVNSYEYPEELTTKEQRKKFRTKMRRLLAANADIKDATKKALSFVLTGDGAKNKKLLGEIPQEQIKKRVKKQARAMEGEEAPVTEIKKEKKAKAEKLLKKKKAKLLKKKKTNKVEED